MWLSSWMGEVQGGSASKRERLKVALPLSRTLRTVHKRWGIFQKEPRHAPASHSRFQIPGIPSSCSAESFPRLWHGSMVSWSNNIHRYLVRALEDKDQAFSNNLCWAKTTYRFFKCPAFADFVFVVVEQFLPDLDHLVAHILDFGHPLCKDTQTKHVVNAPTHAPPCHIPTWCQNCQSCSQGFTSPLACQGQEDSWGGGMYAPCISTSECRFWGQIGHGCSS